ncbi:MAG: hypothetical protein L0332_16630 [Chloroflexi bacterium]|nr:hypothetical protein [Chloroflexota bacterium]MCI0579130.1 hypothetical protein [Chloroflexota bacterium]MCI0643347.1 hypothetical protein [Chloroflexota bacterium]MCI0728326.1 hypothetical protein [Chloroflexota bacterium]
MSDPDETLIWMFFCQGGLYVMALLIIARVMTPESIKNYIRGILLLELASLVAGLSMSVVWVLSFSGETGETTND